jgi:hypothetical protein
MTSSKLLMHAAIEVVDLARRNFIFPFFEKASTTNLVSGSAHQQEQVQASEKAVSGGHHFLNTWTLLTTRISAGEERDSGERTMGVESTLNGFDLAGSRHQQRIISLLTPNPLVPPGPAGIVPSPPGRRGWR